jgi:type IV secretion system protein VirB1
MLETLLLAQILSSCAPQVGPRTMASIITVESDGAMYAIHDNDTTRSYAPRSLDAAASLASGLIAAGHSVDLGLAQINSGNLPGLRLSVRDVFDPCTNIRAGAAILSGAYRNAQRRFGPGQFALRRALGAYNTGSLERGDGYIALVVSAAARRWTGIAQLGMARTPTPAPLGASAPFIARIAPPVRTRARVAARKPRPVRAPDAPILVPVSVVPVTVVAAGAAF